MFYIEAFTAPVFVQLPRADIMVGDGTSRLRFVHPEAPAAV
jgi:hypothetical protein